MAELKGTSLDILKENLKKMEQYFPEAFEEGKINFDILRQILGEYVDDAREKYQFTWNGKGKALHISQTPSMGTLRPCPEKSKNWDATKNLYIEGDNLEVLKILQRSYHRAIKMIYIDPPYNTGHDFVYKDDFKDNIENYKQVTGQVDAEGRALSANTESGGRYHTNWLNMMYPRLRLARNLLADDGAIFISIDDHEVGNLRKICDEIFGEENFIAQLNWKGRGGRQDSKYFAEVHEYILCYMRNKAYYVAGEEPKSGDVYPKYDAEKGLYYKTQLLRKWGSNSLRENRPNLYYPIKGPDGTDVYPIIYVKKGQPAALNFEKIQGCWRWSASTLETARREGRIEFQKNEIGEWVPYEKIFEPKEGEEKTKKYVTWIDDISNGTDTIKNIFGSAVFDYTKSPELIEKFLKMGGVESEDIILDFFSGSATTAHAVMNMNEMDKGHRRFIMVQIPEQCSSGSVANKNGFQTIADIGEERIRRAGALIEKEAEEKNQEAPDTGFKVFRLDSSNIKRWNPDKKDLAQSLWDYVDNFVEGRTEEDVVYEIMLKTGIDLSCPVEKLERDGHTVYSIGMGALFICLDDHVNEDVAKVLTALYQELSPETWKVVFRDNAFDRDADKTNVREMLKCEGLDPVDFLTI